MPYEIFPSLVHLQINNLEKVRFVPRFIIIIDRLFYKAYVDYIL